MDTRITIITPNFNQGRFIQSCIDSVVLQNYPNLEWIIIDAKSTDGSIEILKNHQKQFKHLIIEPDKGTFDAVNKGLKLATGDYICVLNSDDALLPNCLSTVSKFIVDNNFPVWITGGIHVINENSTIKGQIIPEIPKTIVGYTFLNNCWIYHPCTFIKREVMLEIGEFGCVNALDYEYWLRMEKAGYKPMVIHDYLASLRFHSLCKSFDYQKITKEVRDIAANFIMKNNLESKETKSKIKEYDILLFKYKIFNLIHGNKALSALPAFLTHIAHYPSSIAERWYWGAVRRLFVGIAEEEYSPVLYLKDN